MGPIHDRARRLARYLARSSEEGDELFQEAALRALERLGGLRDEAVFPAWFYKVLLSVHRNRARRALFRGLLSLSWAEAEGVPEPAVPAAGEARLDEQRRSRRLRRALSRLPAEQREAVVLFELEELSLDEVAALQGTSVTAVKTRLSRGRKRLRDHYQRVLQAEQAREAAAEAGATSRPEPLSGGGS